MIGKITIGKSFNGCLKYCLNDKPEKELKQEQIMKNRAVILLSNQCFGDEKELIRQFNDVRFLNTKLSKPVMHVSISFAPGERLPRHQLIDICEECAKDLGFERNQFVAVLHKDTKHQHLHIVANRIGFDGKTLSDSRNYQKIARHCRRMELKHKLRQVPNPKLYLSKELQKTPRVDERKELLKNHLKESILFAKNFQEFEQRMKGLKYEVIKSRGIAFKDAQKVYTKGSDIGFSLAKIEKLLKLKPALKEQLLLKQIAIVTTQEQQTSQLPKESPTEAQQPTQRHKIHEIDNDEHKTENISKEMLEGISKALDVLLKPEHNEMSTAKELTPQEIRKRKQKRKGRSHSR